MIRRELRDNVEAPDLGPEEMDDDVARIDQHPVALRHAFDPEVEGLRNRQVKNFFTVGLLAVGTAMLLMGDEVRRTQNGNNNAYAQDNETSWFDWNLLTKHADVHRFVKRLIAGRLQRDVSLEDPGMTLNQLLRQAKIAWHGVRLDHPDWGPDSHALALTIRSLRGRYLIQIMINAYWEQLEFEIPTVPELSGRDWQRWIDTSLESPADICAWDEAEVVRGTGTPCSPVPWWSW